MRLSYLPIFLLLSFSVQVFPQWGGQELKTGATLNSNSSGAHGNYHVEYWKNGGSGSMTLKEGGNFSCEWGQVNNILFREGVRPGTKNEVIAYKADYQPQGNSYLSIYGWFENPLVEYYIIESYGSWNPASDGSRTKHGSVESDSGTYDIFENSRTGESIKGSGTFQQYWSIRKKKRTSGTITCANHFSAWEKAGMKIGTFYEVSFNVEAYQSPGGKADVVMAIGTDSVTIPTSLTGQDRSLLFPMPIPGYIPSTLYNALGQKITGMSGSADFMRQHPVILNASNRASGVYFSIPEGR